MAKSFRAVSPSQSQVFHFRFQIGLRCYIIINVPHKNTVAFATISSLFLLPYPRVSHQHLRFYWAKCPNCLLLCRSRDIPPLFHYKGLSIAIFRSCFKPNHSWKYDFTSVSPTPYPQHLGHEFEWSLAIFHHLCVPLPLRMYFTGILLSVASVHVASLDSRQSQCSSPKYYPAGYTYYFAFFSIGNVLHLIFWLLCSSFVTAACHMDLNIKFEGEVPI